MRASYAARNIRLMPDTFTYGATISVWARSRGRTPPIRANKNEDLIFDVEDRDGLAVSSDVVTGLYVGSLDQELEARLVQRKWRRPAFFGSLVTAFAVGDLALWNRSGSASLIARAGAAAGSSKHCHTPTLKPKLSSLMSLISASLPEK